LVGKPEGKRPLGRPRCRWKDIRLDLREIVLEILNWIDLAWDRDHWQACEYGNEPLGSIKGGELTT
jgi:hypothetical protein